MEIFLEKRKMVKGHVKFPSVVKARKSCENTQKWLGKTSADCGSGEGESPEYKPSGASGEDIQHVVMLQLLEFTRG